MKRDHIPTTFFTWKKTGFSTQIIISVTMSWIILNFFFFLHLESCCSCHTILFGLTLMCVVRYTRQMNVVFILLVYVPYVRGLCCFYKNVFNLIWIFHSYAQSTIGKGEDDSNGFFFFAFLKILLLLFMAHSVRGEIERERREMCIIINKRITGTNNNRIE